MQNLEKQADKIKLIMQIWENNKSQDPNPEITKIIIDALNYQLKDIENALRQGEEHDKSEMK